MRRLWISFALVIGLSFAVLGWAGFRIYHEKPPLPSSVVATDGAVIIPAGQIQAGQEVWQGMGGMELGSIWGHGSYVAPDWSADWLHREAVFILDKWAVSEFGQIYNKIGGEQQAALRERLKVLMRTNSYNSQSGQIILDSVRAEAFEHNVAYYQRLFKDGEPRYAIPQNTLTDDGRIRQLASFSSGHHGQHRPTAPGKACHTPAIGHMSR